MHSRFPAGWRSTILAVAIASLVLLPTTATLAERPQVDTVGAVTGVQKADTQEDSVRRSVTFARGNYVWPYATGPSYNSVDRTRGREPGVLHTAVGRFDLTQGGLGLPTALLTTNRLGQMPAQYFIVQADPNGGGEVRAHLEGILATEGGAIMRSMPVGAVLARLTAGAHSRLQGLPGLIAIEPYHPAFKLDPKIGRVPLSDPVKAQSQLYDLQIRLFAGEHSGHVAETLSKLGGDVTSVFSDEIRVTIDRAHLAAIAALEPVYMIWEYVTPRARAEESTTCMQAGRWNQGAIPYHDAGITGDGGGLASGQTLMILDSGIQMDAAELSHTRTAAGDGVGDPWGSTHRKVEHYQSTSAFGGAGDLLGCDGNQEARTHGHIVASLAVGNATDVAPSYGDGWWAENPTVQGQFWKLDGVAPGARLVAYDGGTTPNDGPCADPERGEEIISGNLYTAPSAGSMAQAYDTHGALTYNFSWGSDLNSYTADAIDVDDFLDDHRDAMVFISAGNAGQDQAPNDGIPDAGSLGTPATTKNGLAIGSSYNVDDPGTGPNDRVYSSAVGPVDPSGRIAPQLMGPGADVADGLGIASEFYCTTPTSAQNDAVSCTLTDGSGGTSFASPAVAAASMLVRDYFAQGFYPDGTSTNPGNSADQEATISGSLVKSVLIASAEYLGGFFRYRPWNFNVEQGYGRVELDNVLPLETWPASPTGLIVVDGENGFGNLSGLDGAIDMTVGGTDSETFEVCDDEQPLRIALAWLEESGDSLVNDLNLEIQAPSGNVYYGNYYTDDDDRDYTTDPNTEDCPSIDGDSDALADWGPWSLPACTRLDATSSPRDDTNPTEAVHLSHDSNGDGWLLGEEGHPDLDPDDDNQIEIGTWTIRVIGIPDAVNGDPDQRYSVALAGGVCLGSAVRLDEGKYTCNGRAKIVVSEFDEGTDPGSDLSVAEIGGRLLAQVIDGDGTDTCSVGTCTIGAGSCYTDDDCNIVDSENGTSLGFTQPDPLAYKYEAEDIILTDGTAYDSGNGVLDVQNGDRVRVLYADEVSGTPDADKRRITTADIDCAAQISFGDLAFGQYGMDEAFLVWGGCERSARDVFEYGFPDKYMDEDELISYSIAFRPQEDFDLEQVEVSLRCVDADADSPKDCRPNSTDCTDPNRTNNTSCDGVYMTVLDSPKTIGLMPASTAMSVNFSILMASSIPGTPEVEMVTALTAPTNGMSATGLVVSRHVLDADEVSVFYSTDWPTGGTTFVDRNNDENITGFRGEYPIPADVDDVIPRTDLGDFYEDYRYEATNWGDLTAGGTKNMTLQSPWHFDVNDGGFQSGIGALSDFDTITDIIAQWGEDKNFNGVNDGYCQADSDEWCEGTDDCADALVPFWCDGTSTVCTTNADCGGDFCYPPCISLEDREAANGVLDQNWSTQGGCGWQTIAPNACSNSPRRGCYTNDDCVSPGTCSRPLAMNHKGGIWHTGTVGTTTATDCLVLYSNPGQCQAFETVSGTTGQKIWYELLLTPEVSKVNDDNYKLELIDWAWNQAIDLPDWNVAWSWEVDTDTEKSEPAHLTADLGFLNRGFGGYGAVTNENNPQLTNGFSVFAPVAGYCALTTGTACEDNNDCPLTCWLGTDGCEDHGDCRIEPYLDNKFCEGSPHSLCNNDAECVAAGQGTVCRANFCDACSNIYDITPAGGNDRVGQNSCYFLGFDGIQPTAIPLLGLAKPEDDDIDNDSDGRIDEYVALNGPFRNMDIFAWNGPSMRYSTLEDIYGEAGDKFQAAVGIANYEKEEATDPDPAPGFGVSIDDMVLEWREFYLDADNVTCSADGECAVIDTQTGSFFEGNTRLEITVLEKSPPPVNDCDNSGDIDTNGVDDDDCDDDGTRDLVVIANSEVETSGEVVFANLISDNYYKAELPVSALYDAEGVLFVRPFGSDAPTVCAVYWDMDDGTGTICKNDPDPAAQGRLEICSSLYFTTGAMTVITAVLNDNKDVDGWADSNETVDMSLLLANKTGIDLSGLTARLVTNDPKIECVIDPVMDLGDWAADLTEYTSETFTFKVADVDRTGEALGPTDDFSAEFSIIISANEFDAASIPQTVTLNLDLDGSGGGGPGDYHETFENQTYGTLAVQNLDSGRNSETQSEGWRCQYSDPDWIYSNSYGAVTDCWLAASVTQAALDFWHIDSDPTDIFASGADARAYDDGHAIYFGRYLSGSGWWTTPMATLEAIGTIDPINLGFGNVCEETRTIPCDTDTDCPGEACVGVYSELTFKHQVSMVDARSVAPMYYFGAVDHSMVALQVADTDTDGTPVGVWQRLEPYYNGYDTQAYDWFTNCNFDPTDDGNTEDDFDDPSDPFRRLGPSSTCHPLYNWDWCGDTDADFAPGNIGRCSEPDSGLQGTTGTGTWVESKLNLAQWRGSRIRIRFLTTALKGETNETWEDLFQFNADTGGWGGDDGWWIDDIRVTDTLESFAVIVNDDKDNSALPGCGSTCDTVTPDLVADPATGLGAPGQVVELDAIDSTANRCVDGTLQYQFWVDGDGNNLGGGVADTLLRGWTDNPVIIHAPDATTTYVVDVRCSGDFSCDATTYIQVPVECPWSGVRTPDYFPTIYAPDKDQLTWTGARMYTWAKGSISTLGTSYASTTAGHFAVDSFFDIQYDVPDTGFDGYWYLLRDQGPLCNMDVGSWQNSAGTEPTRDTNLP